MEKAVIFVSTWCQLEITIVTEYGLACKETEFEQDVFAHVRQKKEEIRAFAEILEHIPKLSDPHVAKNISKFETCTIYVFNRINISNI